MSTVDNYFYFYIELNLKENCICEKGMKIGEAKKYRK